jgi:hypothetical protein
VHYYFNKSNFYLVSSKYVKNKLESSHRFLNKASLKVSRTKTKRTTNTLSYGHNAVQCVESQVTI